jgi:hypothetical protein
MSKINDSIQQKLVKTSIIFIIVVILSVVLNVLLAYLLPNSGSGAEVIFLLPASWFINIFLFILFIIISVKRINDGFGGKLVLPLLFGFVLAYILFTIPFLTFAITR